MKYILEDGTEVEAFSQEEVDTKLQEAVKDLVPKADLDKLTEENKKFAEKDANFTKVKTDSEKVIADLQVEMRTMKDTVVGNHKNGLMAKLSGGDKDLEAKIELEYSQFAGEALTNDQISERMLKSFRNANPDYAPQTLSDAVAYVGKRSQQSAGKDTGARTEDQQKAQAAMGISADDEKKYGSIINK